MPGAVAMAAERSRIKLYQSDDSGWDWPRQLSAKLEWDAKQIEIRRPPEAQ
jgi:hypothetical protein